MNDSTIVTPRGWWDLADAHQFYPSDLPTEWQLAYFANELRATLLPLDAWSSVDGATCGAWRGDVPDSFRFVAEAPSLQPTSPEHQAQMQALEQAMEGGLAAWAAPSSAPMRQVPTALADQPPLAWWRSWQPGARRSSAVLDGVEVPSALHGDLRAARRWLSLLSDRLGGPPRVLILRCPTSLALRQWQDLLDLLGLS